MTYSLLAERLGPLPTYAEVGAFLGMRAGEIPVRIHQLVEQGKLEAVQTNRRKRIVVASLVEYLEKQEHQDAIIAQELERRKIWRAHLKTFARVRIRNTKHVVEKALL